LSNRLSIPATVQTLKRLEMAEKTKDPCPLKRAHTPPPKDDDVVSLGFSDNSMDDELLALASGVRKSRYAALRSILSKTPTKARSVLKLTNCSSLVLDLNKKSNLFTTPLGNVKNETPAEWLLDSGASMHFTNNINDFIDYQVIKPIKVVTANRSTQVTGKGAVILTVGDKAIWIEPVYHIPDLTTKLISLGEFLHDSLHTRGSSRSIRGRRIKKFPNLPP
jgi:hypothetical protein